MNRVRVAQIGVGHDHASAYMESARRLSHAFEVVGIAEPDEANKARLESTALYKNLRRMTVDEILSDSSIDAVFVETDDWNLVHYGTLCVQAGKHLHLDKPPGESVAQYETLMSIAAQRHLVVQLGYMYRYNPAILYCLDAIKDGKLGEIYEVNAVMNTYLSPQKREWLKHFRGGIMHYLGCHMVDCILQIMGKPDEIAAFCEKTFFDDIDAVDRGFAIFHYKRGICTAETTAVEINGYGRRQLVVCGSKGTIEIKPLEFPMEARETYFDDIHGAHYSDKSQKVLLPPLRHRYDAMMADFAKMVRGDTVNPFTYEYELMLHRACLKACGFDIAL